MDSFKTTFESSARTLFRRCISCQDITPACPVCASNERCSYFTGDCNTCPYTTCVPGGSGSGDSSPSSGPPVGAIAGGVVGGIVLIVIVVFLFWWFYIRKRRQQEHDTQQLEDNNLGIEKDDGVDTFSMRHKARGSTHTRASVASSNFTRASNVIQIAYIPGVTNRSIHSSPDLVPPVPPIPAASSGGSAASSPHMSRAEYYFSPGDLRSERSSIATRTSVASTVYRENAVVNPMPAQAITRMKPTAVSVKSGSKNSPDMSRPASPPVPTSSNGSASVSRQPTLNTKSSIVGKFAQPRAITVTRKNSSRLKPQDHTVYELEGGSISERSVSPMSGSSRKFVGAASPHYSHHSSTFDDASSDDDDSGALGRRLMIGERQQHPTAIELDVPTSPLSIPSYTRSPELGGPSRQVHKRNSSINKAIEEATRKAAQTSVTGSTDYLYAQPETSPFSDAHATRTP